LRTLARKARPARAHHAISPQPHRRRQCRRPHEAPDYGSRDSSCHHRRQAGLRTLGADLLRRIRWTPPQKSAGQDHRGVITWPGLRRAVLRRHALTTATRRLTHSFGGEVIIVHWGLNMSNFRSPRFASIPNLELSSRFLSCFLLL